ncbi:10026_t:CDS:2 [Cetraspora pellucida]|uniref:10026_t:CDS:1 n=1 Tax=Cetraspora pellucida TaxID=1433469 RepID=A0A9N9FRW9_9GLOM|nr:10026_t:CDS:2 [Cetraspora pellucida]
MTNIQSKGDLLRELNYKLVTKIDKLRKENAEIPELKKKCAEIEAENIKLKQIIEENANTELKDRVMKLEQIQTQVTINDQNASSTKNKKSIITDSTQLQKGKSKYLFESPTEPMTSITSSQQDIVNDDLASTLEFVEMIHKENVANEIRQCNREKKLQCDSQDDAFPFTQDYDSISLEYVTEILLTSGQEKSSIFQNIAHLYEKALLDKSLDELMVRNKVSMKKAKGQVYDFIIAQNPGIRDESLYKKIERAKKIYRLFEKIGLDKVKYIKSYSTNAISKFTNKQIQMIIDHFTKNSIKEYIDDQDNSSDDLPKTDVGEKTLPKIEVNTLTISQPKLQISAELAQPKASYAPSKLFLFKKKLSKEMHNPVINKLTSHFTNSPKLDKNHSIDTEEPKILYNDVLKAYSGNLKLIQELKTRCFTLPISWNHVLILPDKSIVVEA